QHHREIVGLLLSECASDAYAVPNWFLNGGDFAHTIIEHDRQLVSLMLAGESEETAPTIVREIELNVRTTIFIAATLSIANVAAGDSRGAGYHPILRLSSA